MIENERFFAYDQVSIDASKIEEYEHDLFGPITVFKDVVIAREIVHNYTDGNAYKPASELKDAFWTAVFLLNVTPTRVKGSDTSKLQPGGSSLDRCQLDLAAHNARVTYDGGLSQTFTATNRVGR